jgi:hypothetical protein
MPSSQSPLIRFLHFLGNANGKRWTVPGVYSEKSQVSVMAAVKEIFIHRHILFGRKGLFIFDEIPLSH